MRASVPAALALVLLAPAAHANVGDEVTYVGLLFNIVVEGVWRASTHLGDQWLVAIAGFDGTTDACLVHGTVRAGMAGLCASGAGFAVTGTGHEPLHPLLAAVDVQPRVTVTYGDAEYIAVVAAA